jgi:pSer/pThr/pTyr-binding forkhead associated (FHA) protein
VGLTLRCTSGPLAGELITVDAELVLGRELPDPGRLGGDPRLSRRHARVFVDDARRAVAEDLGSTNGTWVNGERLTERRILADGDRLQMGQTTFEVEVREQPTQLDTAAAGAVPTVADAPPTAPRLAVLAGPMQGEELPLADELLIGRSFGEPGALGGDRLLSRRHARIGRGPGGVFFVEDMGSTNGTLLGGERVRGAQPLKDGDEIKVGSSTLRAVDVPRARLAAELDEPQAGAPAFAPPGAQRAAAAPRAFQPQGQAGARLSSRAVIGAFAAVFAASAIIATVAVLLASPLGSRLCPQGFTCHRPPTTPPLRALSTFTGSLGWRVEYDSKAAAPVGGSPSANLLLLHETDAQDRALGAKPGSNLIGVVVHAYPAAQVSAQGAMQSMASTLDSRLLGTIAAPSSDQMFASPVLGLHPAQGVVLEGNAQTPQGPGGLLKIAVLAASSGGVTIAAGVIYQVLQGQRQANNPDQPLDQFGDTVLETVRFPSDGGA